MTTLEHAAVVQTWKFTAPLSVGSESTKVAFSCAVLTRAALAGAPTVGEPGGVVSTTKLLVADQPDTFAAESVDCARQ